MMQPLQRTSLMGLGSSRLAEINSKYRRRNACCLRMGFGHRTREVGEGQTLTTKTMNNPQFSLANRKQLAEMLGDKYESLRYRIKERFREKQRELYNGFLNEYAEKKGAKKLIGQIELAERKLAELKAELSGLGFDFDDGNLTLNGGGSNPLDKIIDDRVEKAIGSVRDIDARFDSAQVAMMTVATLEDAEKLLKSVSEV
ncbi:MAG: hypothetical protein WCF48_04820 [Terriglobales bacterium]